MLDVKKLLTKMLESFVIESSGNWRYVILGRWFIGAFSSTGTLVISTAVGNVYQSGSNSTITIPVTLSNNVFSDVKVFTASYGVWSYLISKNTTTITYRAMSAISRAATTYNISAIVVGIV